MKCDICKHQKVHLGAGPPDDYTAVYCAKGHWEGDESMYLDNGLDFTKDETRWDECEDFESNKPMP